MSTLKLLLVDDEAPQRELLAGFLTKKGANVCQASDGVSAIALYRDWFSPVALVDMKMPGMSGLELITALREINPHIQIVMLTAFGSVETAVSAMKAGACDYLTKPVQDLDELLLKLERAAEQNRLVVDNTILESRLKDAFPLTDFIGESQAIKKVREMISTVAPTDATVLITGQSGTGKEVVARAIHAVSSRATNRLVTVNCAAFPENLLESELFGYEKGAFTGADKAKPGRFELAEGGTLFLDEIGEMPLTMQVKLLRVIEDRKIERLGSVNQISLNTRIVAATNRNLEEAVSAKAFREDLFYRLNVVRIELPSLKERGGDILLLAEAFIGKHAGKMGKRIIGMTKDSARMLTSYDWPGNVRELDNILERAVILCRGSSIGIDDIQGIGKSGAAIEHASDQQTLAEIEKRAIRASLESNDWNMALTADKLGIHRNTLRLKIKEYGLSER
jgi:DNA-binding NtrC family response regulator